MLGIKEWLLISGASSVLYVSALVYVVAPGMGPDLAPDLAPALASAAEPASNAAPNRLALFSPSGTPPARDCVRHWTACADHRDLAARYQDWPDVLRACRSAANDAARFGRPLWPDRPFAADPAGADFARTGIVTIIDRDVKFQDGYGGYIRAEVRCTYDLKSGRVAGISAR